MRYQSAQDLPIFDTHIHYNQRDRNVISPEQILATLDQLGIRRALVSSIPEDGTLILYGKAPHRIVPFIRPYRTWKEMRKWYGDLGVPEYVEERLRSGIYRGIGEIELDAKHNYSTPVFKQLAEIVAQQQLFFHVDAEGVAVENLLKLYPRVSVIWSTENKGRYASANTIGRLLDQFPNLFVEISQRASDVAPKGTLDTQWRTLFLRHQNRFVIGSASSGKKTLLKFFRFLLHPSRLLKAVTNLWVTWVSLRWEGLIDEIQSSRGWLAQLPSDVAEQIAYKNAERLFGN